MFKLMITFKRKQGLSLDEFIEYYDTKHLDLARQIMPPTYLHRRNYILTEHPFYDYVGDNRGDASKEPPFDVISEVFYESEEAARRQMDALFDATIGGQIMEDEKKFVEPGSINFYVVKVHQSSIPW